MSDKTAISRASSYSPTENVTYGLLQTAVINGDEEEVRCLIRKGVDVDDELDPPLHLAVRKRFTSIAFLLLNAGANVELKDAHWDLPIHIACSMGLLAIVQKLCTLGCRLEVPNSKGLLPLHLAAKYGHIEVIRCLCTAGCNMDVRNSDNIKADITAIKYGHNEIAEVLDKLRTTGQRDVFARQLVPTSKPAIKISLRLLGHCGVGKSALIKSLGAGLFTSLFKRSSSLQSNKSRPSSPINSTQIEMDVTSRQNSLTFEPTAHYHTTAGIHVQNVDISNVGEVCVMEFCGQENYFPVYHHFLWPSAQVLSLILFSLEDPPAVQVQQVCFWVNFLMARQYADLPSCDYGPILLVATHVDLTRAAKTQQGEWISPDAQKTLESVRKMIPHAANFHKTVIVMDANVPAAYAFKQLKSMISSLKSNCSQKTIGTWTGLLDASLLWLANLRKDYAQYPVLYRDGFHSTLRNQVNPLALDENIRELLEQLHGMGEVFCIDEIVVLSLPWFGMQLLGELLSVEFLSNVRSTGVYTLDDFQACFNMCDALGTLELLEALNLCIQCEVDGEVEYEFPVYNQTETLPGLWDPANPTYRTTGSCYGGIRLYTPPNTCHLFTSIFPHIQIELRRTTLEISNNDDMDLYQWYQGSKLCIGTLEVIITLEEDQNGMQCVEVKIRGPRLSSKNSFNIFHDVLQTIDQAIGRVCPGLITEKHILSVQQLRIYSTQPHCYSPNNISSMMLESESTLDINLLNPETEKMESVIQLLLFDDLELASNIEWGCVLKANTLSDAVKLKLCGLLDPPEAFGKDWCLLGLKLGLEGATIASVDSDRTSCTMELLKMSDCTIGALVSSLHELGRRDAAEVVLRSAPLFHIRENVAI